MTQQMRSILEDPGGHGLRWCVLCHGAGTGIGFFFPYDRVARRLRIPKGGIIAYGLCARCGQLPDRIRRVEAFLFARLSVQ